jgi:hypothetical protein
MWVHKIFEWYLLVCIAACFVALLLVLAAPASAVCPNRSTWPACTIVFDDTDTAQEKHDASEAAIPPECAYIEDPVTDEDFFTLWRAPAALTITEIYCEVTGGTSVLLDLEVDDGTPTGVNGSNITCTTSGVADSTLGGDDGMADGDRLDLALSTVTGSVDSLSVCWEFTLD